MREMNAGVVEAMQAFEPIAEAIAARREPSEAELAIALGGIGGLVGIAIDALIRIADAAERAHPPEDRRIVGDGI